MLKSLLIFLGIINNEIKFKVNGKDLELSEMTIADIRHEIYKIEEPIILNRCHREQASMMEKLRSDDRYISLKAEIEDREIHLMNGGRNARTS